MYKLTYNNKTTKNQAKTQKRKSKKSNRKNRKQNMQQSEHTHTIKVHSQQT